MQSSTLFPALDLLTNPVLLTELDGKLIYRNKEALKSLQIPHLTRRIVTHFTPDGRKALRNYHSALPAFLDYTSHETTVTVFADRLSLDGRDVLLFFFSHLFDFSIMEHSRLSSSEKLLDEFSGNKLASLALSAYEREDMPDAIHNRQEHLAATRLWHKLVSVILTELYHDGEKVLYPLGSALEILSIAIDATLTRFGLSVSFPILSKEKSTLLIDFKPFILLFSQILVLLTEINVSKNARISIIEQENCLSFELAVKIKHEYHRIFIGGAESFSYLLPCALLDLFTFNALCKNQGFKFDFALRDNGDDNLTCRLSVPAEKQYTVCDRIDRDKIKILAIIRKFQEMR